MSAARVIACVVALVTGFAESGAPADAAACRESSASQTQYSASTGFSVIQAAAARDERVQLCPTNPSPDPNDPAAAIGGGGGGQERCSTTPFGDPSEVYAIYQSVNAQQTPTPGDTSYVADELQGSGTRTVNASWYKIDGTTVQILYRVRCVDPVEDYSDWFIVNPDASGTFVPQITAIQLVPALQARVIRQLPTPEPRIMPADEDGWTYVQNRTFFFVDQAPGQWDVVSGSTSAGGISVTVQAVPERLVVDPGDGSEPVVCIGAPNAVTRATFRPDVEGCSHIYRHSSATAPNGSSFPATVTIVWHASWSASTGEGGDLGYVSTTSPVRDLQVAEIQAVIIDNDP